MTCISFASLWVSGPCGTQITRGSRFQLASHCRDQGEVVDIRAICEGSGLELKAPAKREVSPEFRKEYVACF
jgi:hypothetical protein